MRESLTGSGAYNYRINPTRTKWPLINSEVPGGLCAALCFLQHMIELSEDGKWYRVSLRLMGDGLAVDEVEQKLQLTPSYVGKKDEHLQGNPRYAKHQTNIWTWRYPSSSSIEFEEQINQLLNTIELKKEFLREILSTPEVEGELFLGFGSDNGQGGTAFSVDLMKRIADFNLTLRLDLYPPSGDEVDDAVNPDGET